MLVGQIMLVDAANKVGVILAGGQSRRMNTIDKAAVKIGESRMIDLVSARLHAQIDRVFIAGNSNYGTKLKNIPDHDQGPAGPVAGVYAIYQWLNERGENDATIYTCPVDAPLLSISLVKNLDRIHTSAYASNDGRDHPTFAKWRIKDLTTAFQNLQNSQNVSLTRLAIECDAQSVVFDDKKSFINVNTPADLDRVRLIFNE